MSNEGKTWLRPEDSTQTLEQTEAAIHQQKLLGRSAIDEIHEAAAEQGPLNESHELVIAMRAIHGDLTKLRLERNWLRHRANESKQSYTETERLGRIIGAWRLYGHINVYQDHQIGGNPI